MPTKNGSGSREKGSKNHIVVLVVAGFYTLPAFAHLSNEPWAGQPLPCLFRKVDEAMGITMAFCF
jgi:hypothetical protein